MKRYISGRPVSNVKDILLDGQDYILILDEGSFSCIDELEIRHPVAALADYKYLFSHIPSYFQMLSIPLFFLPESKNRGNKIFNEQIHNLPKKTQTLALTILEEVKGLDKITVDTLLNTVYPEVLDIDDTKADYEIVDEIKDYKVYTSIKSSNIVDFKSISPDGVGLIFTEFLFFNNQKYPTYEYQRQTLETIFQKNPIWEYTVRLFDINKDKVPKWLENVKLGNYDHPLFERFFCYYLDEQLRCLCDLSNKYPVSILIPYVRNISDIEYIRKRIGNSVSQCRNNVKLGAMIETVSTANEMPNMQNSVDFFSVGSNDLVYSFFSIDRTHILKPEQISRLLGDENFWSLLSKIKLNAGSTPIRMGGQLPMFPEALEKLIKIGYRQFTVSPHWVQQIKRKISQIVL